MLTMPTGLIILGWSKCGFDSHIMVFMNISYVIIMKRCNKCGELKEDSEFYKTTQSRDGLRTYCKQCMNAYSASRYRIPEVHDAALARSCRYYHSKHREKKYNIVDGNIVRTRSVCSNIRNHAVVLQDDPDRLTSDFLLRIIYRE